MLISLIFPIVCPCPSHNGKKATIKNQNQSLSRKAIRAKKENLQFKRLSKQFKVSPRRNNWKLDALMCVRLTDLPNSQFQAKNSISNSPFQEAELDLQSSLTLTSIAILSDPHDSNALMINNLFPCLETFISSLGKI